MRKVIVIGLLLTGLGLYVYLDRIRPGRIPDPTVRGSGTIEATEVIVSPKLAGRLLSVPVDEGGQVSAGQLVAVLDCAELRARREQAVAQVALGRAAAAQARLGAAQAGAARAQAEAQIRPLEEQHAQAVRDHERARSLAGADSLPRSQFEKVETGLKAIERQLAAARAGIEVAVRGAAVAAQAVEVAEGQIRLAETGVGQVDSLLVECELRAPIVGVVAARNYEPGELVLPGAALLRLNRLEQVHTWIYVPTGEVGRVRLGQKAFVFVDTHPDRRFEGSVSRINDRAEFTPKSIQTKEDRTRLVFGVRIELPNPDRALLPGMPVEAVLEAAP